MGGILTLDPKVEQQQIDRVRKLRKNRNQKRVENALKGVEQAVTGKSNIMEPLLEALNAYATLGEISDLLRRQFGEYKETFVF